MIDVTGVLIVMAINAQILPVAAVQGIVVVVVVLVVYRQQVQILPRELATAAAAHPGVELQRYLAIALHAVVALAAGARYHIIQPISTLSRRCSLLRHHPSSISSHQYTHIPVITLGAENISA
jgi:ABC-type enterochelin transport system permease subunit